MGNTRLQCFVVILIPHPHVHSVSSTQQILAWMGWRTSRRLHGLQQARLDPRWLQYSLGHLDAGSATHTALQTESRIQEEDRGHHDVFCWFIVSLNTGMRESIVRLLTVSNQPYRSQRS